MKILANVRISMNAKELMWLATWKHKCVITPKEAINAWIYYQLIIVRYRLVQMAISSTKIPNNVTVSRCLVSHPCEISSFLFTDINECETKLGLRTCGSTKECVNTPGGYDCVDKKTTKKVTIKWVMRYCVYVIYFRFSIVRTFVWSVELFSGHVFQLRRSHINHWHVQRAINNTVTNVLVSFVVALLVFDYYNCKRISMQKNNTIFFPHFDGRSIRYIDNVAITQTSMNALPIEMHAPVIKTALIWLVHFNVNAKLDLIWTKR